MLSLLYGPNLISHSYMTTGKTIVLTIQTFVGKVMSLLFNTLSRFVTAFLLRSKCLNVTAVPTVILEPPKNKIYHCFHFSPSYLPPWSDGIRCDDLSFSECWVLSQLFHSPLLPSSRGFLAPLYFLPLKCYHLLNWGCWYFSWQSWF